jgi:beta-lactamase regulating signal transducer with metallopeptidase domain/biotin carboxyl carrier protein
MDILLRLLEISMALSPVVLALLLAAPLLGRRYGAGLRAFVWLALAVRLVLPFNAPLEHAVRLPIFPVFEAAPARQGAWQTELLPASPAQADATTPASTPAKAEAPIIPPVDPITLAIGVWAIGAAAVLAYHFGAYAYSRSRLYRWSAVEEDAEALRIFEELKQELDIKTSIGLLRSKEAASPLLIGFLRPVIFLPERELTSEQLEFTLRHELCHLKRAELWQKLALLLANAAHWFNPFMWLMARRASIDAELACDAKVLAKLSGEKRLAYGRAVLSLMEKNRLPTPLTSNFYGGNKQMKERFLNIIDENVKKRALIPIIVVLLVIVTASATVFAEKPKTLEALSEEDAAKFSMTVKGFESSKADRYEARDVYMALDKNNPGRYTKVSFTAAENIASSGKYTVTYSSVDSETNTGTIVFSRAGDPDYITGSIVISLADGEIVSASSMPRKAATSAVATFEVASAGAPPEFAWPVDADSDYRVIAGLYEYWGHTGIDIHADDGAPVLAAAGGTVIRAKDSGVGYGKHIIIDHGNGYVTFYAHCSELLAKVGDVVEQGQQIAIIGSSGHAYNVQLHFEVRQNGKVKNPEDYLPD